MESKRRKVVAVYILIILLPLVTHLTNEEMNIIFFLVMKVEIENMSINRVLVQNNIKEKSSNENIRDADLLFQVGAVSTGLKCLQFTHVDDARLSCHISCNLEGLSLMLHKIIDGKFYCENFHLPFGCMLILTNEACHGGCLGSCGSFRSRFALKDSDDLGIERLKSYKDHCKKNIL